jgi:hypothetical protein
VVWSRGGWSRAAPHGEEVGEGPSPTGRRRAGDNSLAVAVAGGSHVGDAWSGPKQGLGWLMSEAECHSNGRRRWI